LSAGGVPVGRAVEIRASLGCRALSPCWRLVGLRVNSCAASAAPAAVGAFFTITGCFWVHWRQAGAAHVHFWRSPAPATAECTQNDRFDCFWTDLARLAPKCGLAAAMSGDSRHEEHRLGADTHPERILRVLEVPPGKSPPQQAHDGDIAVGGSGQQFDEWSGGGPRDGFTCRTGRSPQPEKRPV